jgi:RNA polymerase sigma-70 factor (ECF subfamily)
MGLMASTERRSGDTIETGALASWHHSQDDGVAVTDENLMQRIRSRDETALAILYHRHADMVYSVVRPILTDEGAARDIIPHIFYRIWLKTNDFKPGVSTMPGFLIVMARKCAFDQLLSRGFENGGLLGADRSVPAFNVELMTRVRKTVADLPRSERAPVEISDSGAANWDQKDRHAEQLIDAIKAKIRAALKSLRELTLVALHSGEQGKQEKS